MREISFGRILAIIKFLGDRHIDSGFFNEISGGYEKTPMSKYMEIEKTLVSKKDKFSEYELQLFDLMYNIIKDMGTIINNEPLTSQNFIRGFNQQLHMIETMDQIIGVNEASKILKIPEGTLKNLCASGKVLAKKVGRSWVMNRTIIEDIAKSTLD